MNDLSKYEQFSKHLEEHYSPLYGYILSLLHNPNDADDIFQQTALTLWKKYDEFRPDSNFRAWACGVARLNALAFLRTQRNDQMRLSEASVELISRWQKTAPTGKQTLRQEALQYCMQKLTDLQRELLRRYYEQRENAREIGASLSRTAQSIHSSLKHTREKLHDCIEWRLGEDAANDQEDR